MDYTESYRQTYLKETQHDEQVSRALSYQSPYFVFEFEIIIIYTRMLFFYLMRLKKMGITNKKIVVNSSKIFSSGLFNMEYTEEQFFKYITALYDYMVQARDLYISMCKKNNLEIESFKIKFKDPKKLSFSYLIKEGQKYFIKNYKNLNTEEMFFVELYMNLLKSLAVRFFELEMFDVYDEESSNFVISLHSSFKVILSGKIFQEVIKTLVEINNHLLLKLYEIKRKNYGQIEPTKISTSRKSGKAILISGSNLKELELILEATKDRGINVYTHGSMVLAHTYPKFKTYRHLIGHFSEEKGSYLVDFANFPGSIFLTQYSFLNVENFYRGRIYTTDVIASKNVNLIKDNNFEPLIQSALRAEGFTENVENKPIEFNFSEKEFFDKVAEITQKIETGEIKHLFVIGIPSRKMQTEYFDKFLNLLDSDCFVFSFYYFNKADVILNIGPDYTFSFLYKAFQIITKKIGIDRFNPIILLTRCDIHIFSNLLYLKQIGVEKIYLPDCSPNLVNPAMITFIRRSFDIKNYTNPENDLKDMLS